MLLRLELDFSLVKVSKFQNEFVKSSVLPKMNEVSKGFLPFTVPHYRVEILTIFGSYFGRNDDFISLLINKTIVIAHKTAV